MYNIYATFNAEGLPTGFYHIKIARSIPADAVPITEAQWRDLLDNAGFRKWDGENVVEYIPIVSSDELATGLRVRRDALLKETDYLLMPDYPLSASALAAVKAYRQLLRDITDQAMFPESVVWPEKPEI